MESAGQFSSERYCEVRKPLLEASSLPPDCYTSEAFYRREIECIFGRHWQFVGRAEQLAEHGSFLCFDGPAGPAILLRDESGEIRAFANSCRHRGARLLQERGQCKRIRCPYHSWVYRLDGRLASAPGMERASGFDAADYPLLEMALAEWQGFLFIHYGEPTTGLLDSLGNLPQTFDGHRCGDMQLVGELAFDIRANWKLLAENALEAYHTGSVHRDTLGQQASCAIETAGGWTGLLVEDEHSVATLPGDDKPFPHIDGLGDAARSGAFFTLVYPSTQLVFAQDCAWWLAFVPLAADRTRLTIGACFPSSTAALPGFEAKVKPYFDRWRSATAEDNAICEQQQLGQAATTRSPGRYAASEFAVHAFDNWVLDQVVDHR